MSLQSPLGSVVPKETARVAHAAFPTGNLSMEMQAELGMRSSNPQFASLFSSTGQPAHDPARLALILVMQTIEGLPDRQTAAAVRARIDWKCALDLELTDPGFDASVLSAFRTRLVTGQFEMLLRDTVVQLLQQHGLLQARGKQRTDSTQILAAVRTINRLELVIETMRLALNRLAANHPEWLWPCILPGWRERYALRAENSRLPKEDTKRLALARRSAPVVLPGCARSALLKLRPKCVRSQQWTWCARSGYTRSTDPTTHRAGAVRRMCHRLES